MTSDMKYRYEVGLNGLHGIIVEDNAIEIELKYQSISDLGFYCNFFDGYIGSRENEAEIIFLRTGKFDTVGTAAGIRRGADLGDGSENGGVGQHSLCLHGRGDGS